MSDAKRFEAYSSTGDMILPRCTFSALRRRSGLSRTADLDAERSECPHSGGGLDGLRQHFSH